MNEDFITEAIKNDRYLKAARLTQKFEEEIALYLRSFLEETIEQRSDLFVEDASPAMAQRSNSTEPLARTRMQADMDRVNRDGDNLKFYISIEWTQPEIHDQQTEGALCIVQYKIKNVARDDYDRVKQQTRSNPEWSEIQFSNDVWDRERGIFFIPVSDAHEVKEGLQKLRQHFFSVGEKFGLADESV